MVSFHVLLLDTVGNNLVNADFSPYSRMFFAVKHIYLTLYIAYVCRIAPIYSVPLYLLALLFTSSGPIGSSRSLSVRPRGRARCARARPRALPCPCSLRSLSVLFAPLACPRACVRAIVLPCLSAPAPVPVLATLAPCAGPACSRCSRLYCSFFRRASARWACRKLF